jgi:hypothetical protein
MLRRDLGQIAVQQFDHPAFTAVLDFPLSQQLHAAKYSPEPFGWS